MAPILQVRTDDNRHLQNIANTLAAAKKIVVVTGAGISTNCGVPDFRSEKGLYELIRAEYDVVSSASSTPPTSNVLPGTASGFSSSPSLKRSLPGNVKGKDLFDSQLWSEETSTRVFYRFISSLREKIKQDVRKSTATHRFIQTLRDRRRLVRCYTQNIDGLENREGLSTDLGLGKGNRQRFTKKSLNTPRHHSRIRPGGELDPGCEVVQLHGELETLRCTLCQKSCSWEQQPLPHKTMLLAGTAPLCQYCLATDQDRQDRGKRSTKIGTLRPNIILYGEEHPFADMLGSIMTHDLTLQPDVLLILGTSLHVHGLKTMVREFAKSVHARPDGKGKVIFVNLSKPSESVWKDVFDYWVSMDCDAWVGAMRKHRPDLFQVQEELKLSVRKMIDKSPSKKPSIPSAVIESCKENLVGNSNTPLSVNKACKPMVVVPCTPKKKTLPLQEREEGRASSGSVKVAYRGTMAQTFTDSPALTNKRRRTLVESYDGIAQRPFKRSKGPVSIWTDVIAGA